MIQIIQDTFINKLKDRFKTTQSGKSKEKLQTDKVLLIPFCLEDLQENSEETSFETLKKISNFFLVNFYGNILPFPCRKKTIPLAREINLLFHFSVCFWLLYSREILPL